MLNGDDTEANRALAAPVSWLSSGPAGFEQVRGDSTPVLGML